MKKPFKTVLREKMKEKGVSVRKLEKLSDISNPAICNYLAGRRIPKITDADKLLKALGFSLAIVKQQDVNSEETTVNL